MDHSNLSRLKNLYYDTFCTVMSTDLLLRQDIGVNSQAWSIHHSFKTVNRVLYISRLYNMCEHTWDPNKTWGIYYWEELIPPLIVYRWVFSNLFRIQKYDVNFLDTLIGGAPRQPTVWPDGCIIYSIFGHWEQEIWPKHTIFDQKFA